MSHNSFPARSSRHSVRYSPYTRPTSHPSAQCSPSPSNLDPPASSGGHAVGRLSEACFSPTSDYHIHSSASSTSLHPFMRSWAGCPPAYPSPTLQGVDAAHPSSSNLQLEHSNYHGNMVSPQSQLLAPVPLHHPFHPTTNIPYPDPTFLHYHQPNTLSNHGEHPSVTSYQPGDFIHPSVPDHQYSHQSTLGPAAARQGPIYHGEGIFSRSQNFSVANSTFIDHSTTSDNFMKDFLQHTIIGAEYDSSARDPPPRCHPGTRLAILGRCNAFIVECNGKEKMRWIVGPAGAGKSAIMQMVAEETPADASVFLSVNDRHDGTKAFTTIAYQLAAKYEPYRQFVRNEITRDPSLLRKALPVQFQKFIVDPFVGRQVFDRSCRFVITIDGLDECDNPLVQRQLLELISRFCISRPTSPIVWFIASRPEPHITSFFERTDVQPAYTKEEISIDSDEACEDVQRYLREELNEIKFAYPTLEHKREWPSELEFTKIATAAGGLFAYASTVIRYINDPYYGDPVSQLDDVLAAIDRGLSDEASRNNNPLALLDALYARIISKIPDSSVINARKILFLHSRYGDRPKYNFRTQCNRLGLTEDAAYGAVRHLHAIVKVPPPHQADDEGLTFCHKSFEDFMFDPLRSQSGCSGADDVVMLKAQISSRVLEQTQANFDCLVLDGSIKCSGYGYLKAGPKLCDNILLSWPGDERFSTTDDELRCELYAISMHNICSGFRYNNNFFWTMICFHALTTRFTALVPDFPFGSVLDFAFDDFRTELMDLGKLKQVPVRMLDYAAICRTIEIQLTCPAGMDLWHPNCIHKRSTKIDDGSSQDFRSWIWFCSRCLFDTEQTDIPRFNIGALKVSHQISTVRDPFVICLHCSRRLARQLINNPDRLATVFVDATDMCYVEWAFVDPDDGVSEWRYRFCHSGAPKCVD